MAVTPGAVVVGAHVNGLGVIRALARRGVPIASVSTRAFDVAQHSRWVSERHHLAGFHQSPELLLELLERNSSRWSGWAVFPTNDDAVAVLAQQHDRLSRSYRLPVQPWDVVRPIVDKDRMHALAEDVGLEVPVCYGPVAHAEGNQIRYPVLVKPIQHDRLISSFGVKLFLARDAEELRVASERISGCGLEALVFDYVPGPDHNLFQYCVYLDADREPSPGVTVRKLRQNPPLIGGASVAKVVPEVTELREATIELLRQAGFQGMGFAEFKLDPRSGRFVFVEVNGRAALFNSILPQTGIDLVGMAWSDFVLGERLRPQPTGWRGTWVHLQADVRRFVSHRGPERPRLREILSAYRGPRAAAVWSASDPMPLIAQTVLGMRRIPRLLTAGRRPDPPPVDPASVR